MREAEGRPTLEPTDFWGDYVRMIRKTLQRRGFTNFEKFDKATLDIRFFDADMRLIAARPRTIHKASTFQIPVAASKLQAGLAGVIEKIRTGELLTPHLSKGVFDLSLYDGLWLDWNVHHLHLGEKIDHATGRIERTGPVLFGRFEPDDAYLLGVEQHGAWAKDDVAETVIREWPHLVHEFKEIAGPLAGEPRLTEKGRKNLRSRGHMPLYHAKNGKMYRVGEGFSTARTRTDAVTRAKKTRRYLLQNEGRIAREFSSWCEQLRAQGVNLPRRVRLLLDVDNESRMCVVEPVTMTRWLFPEE